MSRKKWLLGSLVPEAFLISIVMVACSGGGSHGTNSLLKGGGPNGGGGSPDGGTKQTESEVVDELPQFTAYSPDANLRAQEFQGDSSDTNFKPLILSSKAAPSKPSRFAQYYSAKHSSDPKWATQGKSTYPPVDSLKPLNGYTFYTTSLDIREIESRKKILPTFSGTETAFLDAVKDELKGVTPQSPFDGNILNPYFQSIAPERTAFVATTLSPLVAKGWTKDPTTGSFSNGWVYVVHTSTGLRLPNFDAHPWNGTAHPKSKQYEQQVVIPGSIQLSDIVGYVQVQNGKFSGQIYLSDDFKSSDPSAYDEVYAYLSGKNLSLEFDDMPDDTKVPSMSALPISLGGSTGAEAVVDDITHFQYVRKDPDNNSTGSASKSQLVEHVKSEALADAIYRTLDIPAVISKYVYSASKNKHYKIALFLYGAKNLGNFSTASTIYNKGLDDLRENYAADALLANWDINKSGYDNVMVDKYGVLWRVDNGGTLEFRAQGGYKSDYKEVPMDLFSMRKKAFDRTKLSFSTIIDQMKKVVAKKAAVLKTIGNIQCVSPANAGRKLGDIVAGRIDHFDYLVQAYPSLTAAGKSDSQIEGCSKKLFEDESQYGKALPTQSSVVSTCTSLGY